MSPCDRTEELGDYAFDELPASARNGIEQHIATCRHCAAELDGLRLTTAALRILPDREIPQRIAFVSDKVFEPSAAARWFSGFWSSAPRLGFASACVLAVGLIVSAYHRPGGAQQALAPGDLAKMDISAQVNEAVAKAVAQIRAEDARFMQAALEASDRKHDEEHRALMVAMEENLTVLQKRYSTLTMLASNDAARFGAGQ